MGQVLDKFQGIISVKIWIFRLFVSRVTGGKEIWTGLGQISRYYFCEDLDFSSVCFPSN